MNHRKQLAIFFVLLFACYTAGAQSFVQHKGSQFVLDGKAYYYIGTNYWYGGLLALQKDKNRGTERLKKELDFLTSHGIKNLRVIVGAEGSGQINGVQRIGPALQPTKGVFNETILTGLDVLLAEMGKRNMKAVLILSNNWEWSGGFLQYLAWNGLIADSIVKRKLSWDEQRDYTTKFYSCTPCMEGYKKQASLILNRTNSITQKKYTNDPAIMAWELANEPRSMRPAANEAYQKWIASATAFIKLVDKNHLVTLGHEGEMGSESIPLYEAIHADKNVDYLTIHIWPKNWSWFRDTAIQSGFQNVVAKTNDYLQKHKAVAQKLGKPLVIEEFGLPRDGHSFNAAAPTTFRDTYYQYILSQWKESALHNGVIAGANFWAFGGLARPKSGQVFWKEGDDYMGDPPMEEQGLNTVFDGDLSTWQVIDSYTNNTNSSARKTDAPSDKRATAQTVSLYKNLKTLLSKGIMFGHQDDLAYGVGWRYVAGKSDVKELTGDYPAVYGWELGNIEHDLPYNLDSVPFNKMKEFIQQAYERGGVTTISWHGDNPINGESAWDTTHGGVQSILPGGANYDLYKTWLDKIAAFVQALKGKNGEAIPVLFRPFHELLGNWFWWGSNGCTPAEYKLLWRFTADYLRNDKALHNLLFVYNTSGDFSTEDQFMERYPGDDVVDLVSFDSYQYNDPQKDNSFIKNVDHQLTIIENIAAAHNKIAALAETGYERIPYAQWWTSTLWPAISQHKISYVLLWRNHGLQPNGHMHYYVPIKGDVSADDFKTFYSLDRTLFQKDLTKEKLYQTPLPQTKYNETKSK